MDLVGVIDQGTSSSRFIVFQGNNVKPLAFHQIEIERLTPKNGWVEQESRLLLSTTLECMRRTVEKLEGDGIDTKNIKCLGVANQRETVVAWNAETGEPLYNAILWLDARTNCYVDEIQASETASRDLKTIKDLSGLRLSNYFSALKIKWLIENVEGVAEALEAGVCKFGTVDSWLIWNLTGGVNGGLHITDVSNASRTMLMNIRDLKWDPVLCEFFKVPVNTLPEIKSSSEIYGKLVGSVLNGVPISGCLGDQQAALLGHKSFLPGQAKCTFGTGCFLLFNTGDKLINTCEGLLTTVAYKLGPRTPTVYALEGSAGVAGAAMRWLKDNMGIADSYEELSQLADSVEDSNGVYFVPAFSGLFAPHWRPDAKGTICGLTTASTKAHVAKASYEATAFQVRDVLEAMRCQPGLGLTSLKVDGGMTANSNFVQLLADIIGIETRRPVMPEATALGAAMAAGFAEGIKIWDIYRSDADNVLPYYTFTPNLAEDVREERYSAWKDAVYKSFGRP